MKAFLAYLSRYIVRRAIRRVVRRVFSGRGQRGYTLVEMMIALTVLGFVLGGALVPLKARYEKQQNDATGLYLLEAKEAVMTYALQNRTYRRVLTYYDGLDYTIANGRPYLPCPDVDNDGVEDRAEIDAAVEAVDTSSVDGLQSGVGQCAEQKGMLPWKTLGLKENDAWGTRLTYRVDSAFSDQLMGFDETFNADMFDRRENVTGADLTLALRGGRDDIGSVVCGATNSAVTTASVTVVYCPTDDLTNVLAGVIATIDITLSHRVIDTYDAANSDPTGLIDGAAFVIVSHGKNGQGGMSNAGRCRVQHSLTLPEQMNAYYPAGHALTGAPYLCGNSVDGLYENMFSALPVSALPGHLDEVGDDLVIWAAGNELFGFLLRGGAMPIEKLGFLP